MKTLLLMRHAKSNWKNPKLADHDRPLAKRGHQDAAFMGQTLAEKELLPQKVLASSAVRVSQTLAEFIKRSGCNANIDTLESLYLAEPETYLAVLRSLPPEVERVMVVGHNPGLEGLLQAFTGRVEPIETATIAYISLPIVDWNQLCAETEGELVELLHSRALRVEKPRKDKKAPKKEEHKAEKKSEKKPEKKAEKKPEKKAEKKDKHPVEIEIEVELEPKTKKSARKTADKKDDKKTEKKSVKKNQVIAWAFL